MGIFTSHAVQSAVLHFDCEYVGVFLVSHCQDFCCILRAKQATVVKRPKAAIIFDNFDGVMPWQYQDVPVASRNASPGASDNLLDGSFAGEAVVGELDVAIHLREEDVTRRLLSHALRPAPPCRVWIH